MSAGLGRREQLAADLGGAARDPPSARCCGVHDRRAPRRAAAPGFSSISLLASRPAPETYSPSPPRCRRAVRRAPACRCRSHRDLGAHAVRPEAVDLAFLERLGGEQAERCGLADGEPGTGPICTSVGCVPAFQQLLQPIDRARRRSDAQAFDAAQITFPASNLLATTRNQYMCCASAQSSFAPCQSLNA